MKPATINAITQILSDRLFRMIEQLSNAKSENIPALATAIDESSAVLTDFVLHTQSSVELAGAREAAIAAKRPEKPEGSG